MNIFGYFLAIIMALTFAFPATTAFADDNDDDRRSHVSDRDKDDDDDDDDDDDKKKKKKKKKRDRDDDVELELERVVYNAKKNQLRVSGELDDFEGRAELTVTDTALGLELGTIRVRGDDDFSKSISLDGLPVPCRVTVSIGGESVSKKVKRAPDTCSKFTKTITGLVTDGPIPFATVSVTVGGVTYTTVADENGFYSLDVATATVEELIQIGATGTDPETGTPIEFVNLTGTFEQLLSDEPQNVTNVTTASYILAVEANGGTEPTTLAELQAAETAVDATELFELAAVIKLLVDDPNYVLPPGFNSVLDFASDSTAVSDFVATADPADVDQALEAILADSNLVVGFDENGIPARYLIIPTANPGYLARVGDILEFDSVTKTGSLLSFSGFDGVPIEQTFTWLVENGALVITYDTPFSRSGLFNIEDTSATPLQIAQFNAELEADPVRGPLIEGVIETVRTSYTLVTDGTLVDVVSTRDVRRITWPDIELFVTGITLQLDPVEEASFSADTLRSGNDLNTIELVADCGTATAEQVCVPGVWGGTYAYEPGVRFFDGYVYPATNWGEVLDFATNGTVNGVISGVVSNWSVVDGSLVITYASGTVQTATLVDNLGVEYGVLNEYQTPEGRFATYNIWVKGDALTFTDEFLQSPPGKYWAGEINTWIPGFFNDDGSRSLEQVFGWIYNDFVETNSGQNIFSFLADNDGDGVQEITLGRRLNEWSITDNVLKIDRFLNPGLESIDRFWYPIAATTFEGDRQIYVMEVEFRFGGLLFPARLNIERELDVPTGFDLEVTFPTD